MTEFITVSPESGLEAARRQLAQHRHKRIVLELPEGWTGLDNMARVRLIQRQAQYQRCDLALVTRDEATRKAAQQLGVPVYAERAAVAHSRRRMQPLLPLLNSRHPERSLPDPPPWRHEDVRRRAARPERYLARRQRIRAEARYRKPLPGWMAYVGYSAAAALVGLCLLFFLIYVLPAATITLTPGREALALNVPLLGVAGLDAADPDLGQLPARLAEVTIDETGSVPTSGSEQKPSVNAQGQVVFSNLGTSNVFIPPGTEVSTSSGVPVTFRTLTGADLAGGVGERVTVAVEATAPGVEGNVRAGTINTVNGPLRFRVRATNLAATFGGGSELVPVVTQADQDNLRTALTESANRKAYEQLIAQLEPGEWLAPESVQTFVLAEVFDQYRDDQATELGLNLRVLAQGVAVGEQETHTAGMAALEQAVPARGRLVASTVNVARQTNAVSVGQQVEFTITATAEYVIPIDPGEVSRQVAGLSEDEAVRVLQDSWQLARPPEIYRDPEWVGALPRIPNRIQVRVDYDALAAQ